LKAWTCRDEQKAREDEIGKERRKIQKERERERWRKKKDKR
jgi:hypothetical protein